ncbi:MAG: TauD/TfdA family dioxygenase [Actinomycetota bacterium]|nr:TauD/TfdA family dioxygenase [Actinomycetota bacterium]
MSVLGIDRIAGALGAELTGIDLTRTLTDAELTELRDAVVQHKVVFLRDQPYATEHLVRLTEQLGGHGHTPFLEPMPDHPGVVRVVKEANENGFNFGGAWHSDWSFQPEPPAFTLLWSVDVPPQGGDTMWSNQQLAYETLSDGLRATLDQLDVVHSAGWAYSADGVLARSAQGRSMQINTTDDALAEHVHPAVLTHPESGARALFVNPTYTVRFDGWSVADSAPLLQHLYAHSTRDAFTCRFRWTANTLAIWDNRSTQHNALNDYRGHRRELHRTTVAGSAPRR